MPTHHISKGSVLITGGAVRIGRSMALKLSEDGYRVAILYNRSRDAASKLKKEIERKGGSCQIFACNLERDKEVTNIIPRVTKACPDLKVLINNASIFERSDFLNSSIELFDRHMAVHLKAPFILSAQFAKRCKKGDIINILDTHITTHRTGYFAYLLSKKALWELTKMSAAALAPDIRVNAIAPGPILPPKGKGNDYLTRLAHKIPLKRAGSPLHITSAIQFLLSNDYITGQVIYEDGGEHLL